MKYDSKQYAPCAPCDYLGTDNCGPGTVMMCLHPIFDKVGYDGAIILWKDIKGDRIRVSNSCPKQNSVCNLLEYYLSIGKSESDLDIESFRVAYKSYGSIREMIFQNTKRIDMQKELTNL